VRNYVRGLRQILLKQGKPPMRRPSTRRCAWWLLADEPELTEEQRTYVASLTARCPEIRLIRFPAQELRRVLSEQDTQVVGPSVEATQHSLLRRFACGIRTGMALVRAVIVLTWSKGPVQGRVKQLKMIKRQTNNRAGSDLNREPVLYAA